MQGTRQVFPRLEQRVDLLIEQLEALPGDGLPFTHVPSIEHSGNVVKGETGVLEHSYEDKSTKGGRAVSALPGRPRIGDQQIEPLVVADPGRRNLRPFRDLSYGQKWIRHQRHLT